MSIKFTPDDHKYVNLDPSDALEWTSVTSLVSKFKPKFDAPAVAQKCSRSKKSKWYGLQPDQILEIWNKESKRATDLGTWYHNQRENELLACDSIRCDGENLTVISSISDGSAKIAGDQVLLPGIYPEHLVFLRSAGICGQADRIEIVRDIANVYDYKTNKEIKTEGFTSWDGVKTMMLGPCSHLEHCEFNHYALQLSLYMYIILKHNHYLNPGKLQIEHVSFEEEAKDEHGYPIIKYDELNEPVVKTVEYIELPYLKTEVINMIKCHMEEKNGR